MEVFRGFFEFQGANLVGAVSDESGSSEDLDRLLDQLMRQALAYALNGYLRPHTFLGVGGMKVFRDDIYGRLRMIFPQITGLIRRLACIKLFHKWYSVP